MKNPVIKKKKIIGTYILIHYPSKMMYVGSSADLEKRLYDHGLKLRAGKNRNKALQAAYDYSPDIRPVRIP